MQLLLSQSVFNSRSALKGIEGSFANLFDAERSLTVDIRYYDVKMKSIRDVQPRFIFNFRKRALRRHIITSC